MLIHLGAEHARAGHSEESLQEGARGDAGWAGTLPVGKKPRALCHRQCLQHSPVQLGMAPASPPERRRHPSWPGSRHIPLKQTESICTGNLPS